jgi:hypothetical protein
MQFLTPLTGFRNARTPFGAQFNLRHFLGGVAPELDASPPPEALGF